MGLNLSYYLDMVKVGIAVIACGESYLRYSQKLIETLDSKVSFSRSIKVYVMTDQQSIKVNSYANLEVIYIPIAKLEWPQATLLRYRLIEKFLSGEDLTHVFYMDADLEVINEIEESDLPLDEKFFCVAHPGFFNRGFLFRLIKKVYYPPWETNSKFSCALPLRRRKTYVAGGFWGGSKSEILTMCNLLSRLTDRDIELGLYPRSYDESYLNWWIANNQGVVVLTPVFLFAEQFPWLEDLQKPRILAVTKDQATAGQKAERDVIFKHNSKNRF